MTFFYGRRGPFYKLFVRGDSNGKVNVWKMPEVSDKELNYLKQEEFDTLPGKLIDFLYSVVTHIVKIHLQGSI